MESKLRGKVNRTSNYKSLVWKGENEISFSIRLKYIRCRPIEFCRFPQWTEGKEKNGTQAQSLQDLSSITDPLTEIPTMVIWRQYLEWGGMTNIKGYPLFVINSSICTILGLISTSFIPCMHCLITVYLMNLNKNKHLINFCENSFQILFSNIS